MQTSSVTVDTQQCSQSRRGRTAGFTRRACFQQSIESGILGIHRRAARAMILTSLKISFGVAHQVDGFPEWRGCVLLSACLPRSRDRLARIAHFLHGWSRGAPAKPYQQRGTNQTPWQTAVQ
jgi:hypothetical protein